MEYSLEKENHSQVKPVFSIVIPIFNRAHGLPRTLDSIRAQNFEKYETIVIDDGSSDDVEGVIGAYRKARFIFLRNDKNLGVGPTRNRGVRAASGDWIIFLDNEDCLLPHALRKLDAIIQGCDEKIAAIFGRSTYLGQPRKGERQLATAIRGGFDQFVLNPFPYGGDSLPIVRRNILLRFPFDETLNTRRECGGLVWYAILRAGYECLWTQEFLRHYELSPDGLSGRNYLARNSAEMVICNERIIETFGNDLLRISRTHFVTLLQKTAFYCIMAGHRRRAIQHARNALRCDPTNMKTLFLFPLWAGGPWAARHLYRIVTG